MSGVLVPDWPQHTTNLLWAVSTNSVHYVSQVESGSTKLNYQNSPLKFPIQELFRSEGLNKELILSLMLYMMRIWD